MQEMNMQMLENDSTTVTDTGQVWAEIIPFSRNGHSGCPILWNPAVTGLIREEA
jgi:hypothetical protein